MSNDRYERLAQADNTFLVLEDAAAHMHVGSTQVFEGGALQTRGGGIDAEKIRAYLLSRLHRIPRYRQRLATTPLARRPIWVDDDRFNLFYHVRHTRLPAPGDERLLKRVAGRIMSQPLDLHKPLWEMWVIEGLEGGRFATVTKVHHCMIDGISGADLISTLLSPQPTEDVPPAHAWVPRPAPTAVELFGDELVERLSAPFTAAGALWRIARNRGEMRQRIGESLGAAARMVGSLASSASPSPFNQPIGPYWRFDWHSTDLGELRAAKARLGGTLNDMVLAIVAGAVRRYFTEARGISVAGMDFRVMAPVSTRAEEQRGALGNQVSAWMVPLPLTERDPVERLRRIREVTGELKASKAALGAETLTLASEWMGTGLLSLGAQLAKRTRPFNMVVTNVPGPPVPLYMLGARMVHAFPMVPLFGSLATGIALFSYAGKLHWGIMADWETVPDLHELTLAIEASFAELRDAGEPAVVELRTAAERKEIPRAARAPRRAAGHARPTPKDRRRTGSRRSHRRRRARTLLS